MRKENQERYYRSYTRLERYIDNIMIIKVVTDATVAIIMTLFVSSDGFWPIWWIKSSVVVFIEKLFALTVFVIDTRSETIGVVVVVVPFVVIVRVTAVAIVLFAADVLDVCVVDTNCFTGSIKMKSFINVVFITLNNG